MFSKSEPQESADLTKVTDQELANLAAASLAPKAGEGAVPDDSRMGTPLDLAQAADGEDEVLSEGSDDGGLIAVPLLGQRTAAQHRSMLSILLAISLIVLATSIFLVLRETEKTSRQVAASGQALMQSQRLAKSVSQALVGSAEAFPEVRDSSEVLSKSLHAFQEGDTTMALQPLDASFSPLLGEIAPRVDAASRSAAIVLAQEDNLTRVSASVRAINNQTADLLELAETVASLKLQANAPTPELSASSQMVMLTQRIGKSANELLTLEGVSPEAVFLLGKDLNTFKELGEGLLNGNEALRLRPTSDPQIKENLETLLALFADTLSRAQEILGSTQGLAEARAALDTIVKDSEPLRQDLQKLQNDLSDASGLSGRQLLVLLGSAVVALLCAGGLAYVQLQESRVRQLAAERQRIAAESEEQDAKRVNDANQAAILRLMNELQTVAEGDLTQEATVTEDITGAIADSVNYTVEELRSLVGNVQATATRVAQTTSAVESTSTELLAASNEQLREIRETGQSVVDMAQRINQVSGQAQESAQVARSSLQAAEQGLQAVQNAIGGMNAIRDQIQDTSKRIKRLGESSQEIGEITELISDITEQTNVLALNAAIQAASAGEAGRGFSVVAEEVQRLAERSGDATRQIAALVKTIQTDTQDAVGAMERSTQGVVEGAKLSDNAGAALTEIDQVSRRLAELIEQISQATSREADSANEVAGNIQHIFAVTEQTGEGTRSTAQQVRELSAMAEELRQSVSRFKIA
ncbi:MAG: methyl-accepting chemotaxis protein [Burkholderiaceae bacterium]